MKAKKVKKVAKKVAKKGSSKPRGVRGKSGLTVCATWLKAFETKAIKTKAQCSAKMKVEFPKRKSAIFNFPNTVKTRANNGLLDGKKHKYAKYPKAKKAS